MFDFHSISSYFFTLGLKMKTGVNIKVSGMVQGVGFRYFVYGLAADLKINGYVRNLYDGDVEIDAEGERSMLEELIKEVKVGPRAAHVADLKISWKDPDRNYKQFEIR